MWLCRDIMVSGASVEVYKLRADLCFQQFLLLHAHRSYQRKCKTLPSHQTSSEKISTNLPEEMAQQVGRRDAKALKVYLLLTQYPSAGAIPKIRLFKATTLLATARTGEDRLIADVEEVELCMCCDSSQIPGGAFVFHMMTMPSDGHSDDSQIMAEIANPLCPLGLELNEDGVPITVSRKHEDSGYARSMVEALIEEMQGRQANVEHR